MASASGTASPVKDRKKSAHWTDSDTETLVNILLRYKDTGRTPDNGFRPEIWKEASLVLEKSTFMGGPKTPEACKSRWQRIQRDYRAAKDIEAFPGFTWDRHEGRLIASPEAWKAAEGQLEPYKYSKIHLTCFDTLAILCPNEPVRSRARTKGRSSHASTSDTSSMISLSVTGSTGHLDDLNGQAHVHAHAQAQAAQAQAQAVQAYGGHHQSHAVGSMQMGDMQGGMIWEAAGGDEDGEGEFDSFTLGDGSQHPFMTTQKRMQYDPSMITSTPPHHSIMSGQTHSNGASPPKKPRLSNNRPPALQANHQQLYAMTLPRSPSYVTQPTLLDPAVLTPTHHQQQQQQHHNQQSQNQQQPQHQPPNHPPQQNHLVGSQHSTPNHPNLNHNQLANSTQQNQNQTQNQSQAHNAHVHANTNTNPAHHQVAMPSLPSHPHTPTTTTSDRGFIASPANSLSAEIHHAGLSDAQRRTQAILQLQQEPDLRDEDTIEVMAEFENNIAAADTYLAVKKDQLRIMYLKTIVQRRKQAV